MTENAPSLFGEKSMTVREVAEILGVDPEAIKKHIRDLYPDLMLNGVTTYLDEKQVTEIKSRMIPTTQVVGAVTELEMVQKTQEVLAFWIGKAGELKAQLATAAPKAKAFDHFISAENVQTIRDTAKLLGTGQNRLFTFLIGSSILMKNCLPYQQYIERGYFIVKERTFEIGDRVINRAQTFVTAKGIQWISRLMKNEVLEVPKIGSSNTSKAVMADA